MLTFRSSRSENRNNVYRKVVLFVYNTKSSQYLYTFESSQYLYTNNVYRKVVLFVYNTESRQYLYTLFLPLLTGNIFVRLFYLLFVYNHLKKCEVLKSLIFLRLKFILAFSVLYTFSNHCIQIIGKKV
jgi:hypothetical protein